MMAAMAYVAVNPATGEEVARFDYHSAAEIERRLDRAHDAWRDVARDLVRRARRG